jgi:hypothetical protein
MSRLSRVAEELIEVLLDAVRDVGCMQMYASFDGGGYKWDVE